VLVRALSLLPRGVLGTLQQSKSCRDELGAPEVVGANKEDSVKHPKGNKGCSSVKVTLPTAQMKCLYMNTNSMGNKQEELEATMLLGSYDLTVLIETWWDESHDWSVAISGYRLFRRDRWGKTGEGVAFYIKKSIQCEELSLKNSHEQIESLFIRIRDRGKGTWSWASTTGCLIKGSLLTKPSSSSSRRLCAYSLLSCWGTSTTPTSAGRVAQGAAGNPGDS